MRVLFSCFPGYGHLFPLIPLARACQRAGHDVLVTTGLDLCHEIERHGLVAAPTGLSLAETYARHRAAVTSEPTLTFAHAFVAVAGRARAADLVPLATEWSPDLIIHDEYESGAAIAAAVSGTARAIHGLGVPMPADFAAMATDHMEALFTEWGLDRAAAAAIWAAPYLDIYPRSLRPDIPIAASDLRPLRPEGVESTAGPQLPDWAGRLPYARTVYVTLGTMFNDSPRVFAAILAGLRGEPVNAIVTVGPNTDPTRFGPSPDGVVIERFIPQALVLPRCDAVIAHGGSGTMLASLTYGLPQVLLPQGADQFNNAAACAGAGAGIALPPGEVTPGAIRAAIGRVLDEPGYRARARELAAEIAAMPSADDLLADLVREVRPLARSR